MKTPANKAESMGEVKEEMGSSRDQAHAASDGQGNPALADSSATRASCPDCGAPVQDRIDAREDGSAFIAHCPRCLWLGERDGPSLRWRIAEKITSNLSTAPKTEKGLWLADQLIAEFIDPAVALLSELDGLRANCAPDELGAVVGRNVADFVSRYRLLLGDFADGVGRAPRPPVIDGASSRDEPPSPPTGRALLKENGDG